MDVFATNKNDMLLVNKLFGSLDGTNLPVSFKLGEEEYKGINGEFSPKICKRIIDSNVTETIIEGENKNGIKIRAEIVTYTDFSVVEWRLFFENTSSKTSAVLSELKPADFVLLGKSAVLQHCNGDTRRSNAYETYETEITEEPLSISSINGTSCEGAFPYMRLVFSDYIANIAIGWTGEWQASFKSEEKGVRFTAGQHRFYSKIYSGETFVTPKITVMLTDTNDQNRAMNMWRRWYFAHIIPKPSGKAIGPKSCMHVFNDNGAEFTGTTTENQIKGLKNYVARNLKPDVWWIDAGWYKCDKNWRTVGTWEEDEIRFPENGLAPIGECCKQNGVEFLLWFEPERVNPDTWLAKNHPEWCLKRKDGKDHEMLLDLSIKDACDWVTNRVDELIKKWHVAVYRQDFNVSNPGQIWVDYDESERIGARENLHIQALFRFWDTLLQNNKGLWIDCCSSGGRRNDLETLRRAVPLHYTDVGYGNHPVKQCQHQLHFEWIPYFRAHNMSWDNADGGYDPYVYHNTADEFAYMNAMTPAITVMTTAWGDEAEFEMGRKMLPIWRKAAEIELRADYFSTTKSTKSNKDIYAVEFSDKSKGDGFVHVIRNTQCEIESVTMKLHVCENAKYLLENPISGETKTLSGAELCSGFTITLKKRSGVIWFYKKMEVEC